MDIEVKDPAEGTAGPEETSHQIDSRDSLAPGSKRKQEISLSNADWELVKRTPTLMAYVNRVGATVKSFRRYVIESPIGKYKKEAGSITVSRDGEVHCYGVPDLPTEAELAAIEKEVAAANWPTSTPAARHFQCDRLVGYDPSLVYEFLSRDGQHVEFIQQRIETDDGGKAYVPWSFWSDGNWRQMEPDGLLPLFGLEKLGEHSTVFIHEGAKAARYVQWMIEGKTKAARDAFNKHPWNKELSGAAHLGWAGGAPSPHRTDWSVLRRTGIKRIYVVADYDQLGIEAVRKISKLTLLPMTAIIFDDCFKQGFDLADPWPDATTTPAQPDWWKEERYLGPSFHQMCIPATWATTRMLTGKKGRPEIILRDEFVAEWLLSKEPHVFAHRHYSHLLLKPEPFNQKIAPFSDGADVAKLLVEHLSVHADGITYRPHKPDGNGKVARVINVYGDRKINTYRPPTIKPAPGNVLPFLRYMTYLIPNKGDRHKLLRWCATLIAQPHIRMRYSVLLISEKQGVGKTTLSDAILKPLVGPWNVSTPNEQQIVDSAFNGWVAHRRLASVNEIYTGERRKAYDRLKAVTAGDNFEVHRKFMEPYDIENWCHVVACSNSIQAIHLDDTDRRFLVPGVVEEIRPKEWWARFYAYLNGGGLGAIAAWAEAFVRKHGAVETGDRAPDTSKKQEVISASRTEGAQMAYDLAKMITSGNLYEVTLDHTGKEVRRSKMEKVVVRMDLVRAWVAERRGLTYTDRKLESALTLRRAMMSGGLLRPEPKVSGGRAPEHRLVISGSHVEVLANFPIEAGTKWAELEDLHRKPSFLIEGEM